MFFKAIKDKIKQAQKLEETDIMYQLFRDEEFRDTIIQLNTVTQLYEQGIDSAGESIGEYSPNTIEGTWRYRGKKQKGQPYDRVTLKDTGAFYKSFRCYWAGSGIGIKANSMKGDTDLLEEWGRNILGLTEDSLSQLRYIAKDKIIAIVRNKIIA